MTGSYHMDQMLEFIRELFDDVCLGRFQGSPLCLPNGRSLEHASSSLPV